MKLVPFTNLLILLHYRFLKQEISKLKSGVKLYNDNNIFNWNETLKGLPK